MDVEHADSKLFRIMIAVNQSSMDGYPHPSKSSSNAFEWVLHKLIRPRCKEDYLLYILHVQVPDSDGFDDVDSVYATARDFVHMHDKEQVHGLHLLEYFVHLCDESEVSCKAWIRRGDPKEVICKESASLKPDMLVMGSRGIGTLSKLFIGSVSEHCNKHASCPVLVIKRNPEDAPDDPSDD